MIAILDFKIQFLLEKDEKYFYKVRLKEDETNEIFYPKLTFIYIELPKFKKKTEELKTKSEKWFYLFRNLESLEIAPETLKENIFMKLMKEAKLANLPKRDRETYEASLKRYRDNYSVLEYAKKEAKLEGKIEMIHKAFKEGFSISQISKLTDLSEAEVEAILKNDK